MVVQYQQAVSRTELNRLETVSRTIKEEARKEAIRKYRVEHYVYGACNMYRSLPLGIALWTVSHLTPEELKKAKGMVDINHGRRLFIKYTNWGEIKYITKCYGEVSLLFGIPLGIFASLIKNRYFFVTVGLAAMVPLTTFFTGYFFNKCNDWNLAQSNKKYDLLNKKKSALINHLQKS